MGVWVGLSIVKSVSVKGPVAFITPYGNRHKMLPVDQN